MQKQQPKGAARSAAPLARCFLYLFCVIFQLLLAVLLCFSMISAEKIGFPGPFCPGPIWGLPNDFLWLSIQRAELLKQECHTGKVVSNIHRLGPKNTQKLQMNWKTIGRRLRRRPTGGGASRRPLWVLFFNSLATFCVFFGPSLCMLLATFPVWHSCFNNSALCMDGQKL